MLVLPHKVHVPYARSVDVMLNMLLLTRAADTVIGDDMTRGVSGGEKKRVTTGEMLVSAKLVAIR